MFSHFLCVVGAMVAAGTGIAAIPQLALRLMDTTALKLLDLKDPVVAREIGLLTRKQRSLSAAAITFLDTLRQQGTAWLAVNGQQPSSRSRRPK